MQITDSIIPLVDRAEKIENLDPKKYSKRQFESISAALLNIELKIRLVSYNMLYNIQDHELDEFNRWPQRLPKIIELLNWIQPDIICSQELHRDQLNELLNKIGNVYIFFGEENKDKGEIDGIFFKISRFELIESHFWKIFQNLPMAYPHTLSKIVLKDKKTNKNFAVFNTHLPYFSPDQREFSAYFIKDKIEEMSKKMPLFLAGDFNTIAQRLDIPELPFLDGDFINQILTSNSLRDTKDFALLGHIGPLASFTSSHERNDGSPFKGTGVPGIILDHIYSNQEAKILIHAIEPARVDGRFPSDHMPVLIDFIL